MVGLCEYKDFNIIRQGRQDIFKVENNPTDDGKLVLTINRQPIGEWFKEQFGKLGTASEKHLMNWEKEEDLDYKR